MQKTFSKNKYRYWLFFGLSFIAFIFLFLSIIAQRFIEPLLKDHLHTLIIKGSDSLYTYTLGNLHASFLGGNVEVENLHIDIDSARYRQLKRALPSVTLQLNLIKGKIYGVGVLSLLFSKKILVDEIISEDANIRLMRHMASKNKLKKEAPPLWKLIQPDIKSISIGKINLDGVKFLYRHADTAASLKLQFDTCYAIFKDVLIDSAASADENRMGFAKEVSMRFRDLKFRSADSTMKLKAEVIEYSSATKTLDITEFKMQPTLKEKKDFYAAFKTQKAMNVVEFARASLTNFRLDRFVRNNVISADSLVIHQPSVSIYLDKTQPPVYINKTGSYPHQKVLTASSTIQLKGIAVRDGKLAYTERGEKSNQEGTLSLSNLFITVSNITNDAVWVRKNPLSIATVSGHIWGSSPLNVRFRFPLGETNGRFMADGIVKNVSAAQLNKIAEPLGNAKFQSFHMQQLNFSIKGDDLGSTGNVRMLYNNLSLVLNKADKETGVVSPNKFLTRVVNKYTLKNSNPEPGGFERVALNVKRARPTSQAFFGLVWKTIFAGMQQVMMGSGTNE